MDTTPQSIPPGVNRTAGGGMADTTPGPGGQSTSAPLSVTPPPPPSPGDVWRRSGGGMSTNDWMNRGMGGKGGGGDTVNVSPTQMAPPTPGTGYGQAAMGAHPMAGSVTLYNQYMNETDPAKKVALVQQMQGTDNAAGFNAGMRGAGYNLNQPGANGEFSYTAPSGGTGGKGPSPYNAGGGFNPQGVMNQMRNFGQQVGGPGGIMAPGGWGSTGQWGGGGGSDYYRPLGVPK